MSETFAKSLGKRIGRIGLATVSVIFVTLLAGSFLADAWWIFELLASWRVLLTLVLSLLIATELIRIRRPWVILTLCAATLAGLASIAPFYVGGSSERTRHSPSEETDARRTQSVTIAWGNTPGGEGNLGVRELVATGADLIMAAEVGRGWDAADAEGYSVAYRDTVRGDKAVLVLSRVPVVSADRVVLAGGAAAVEVVLEHGGQAWRILAVHLQSPKSAEFVELRNQNLNTIAAWAKQAARTGPCVVVGDFNTTPMSPAFGRMKDVGELINSMDGRGMTATWPIVTGELGWLGIDAFGVAIPIFGVSIDHLLHSRDVTTVDRKVLGLGGRSDHAGILVRLEVLPQATVPDPLSRSINRP